MRFVESPNAFGKLDVFESAFHRIIKKPEKSRFFWYLMRIGAQGGQKERPRDCQGSSGAPQGLPGSLQGLLRAPPGAPTAAPIDQNTTAVTKM